MKNGFTFTVRYTNEKEGYCHGVLKHIFGLPIYVDGLSINGNRLYLEYVSLYSLYFGDILLRYNKVNAETFFTKYTVFDKTIDGLEVSDIKIGIDLTSDMSKTASANTFLVSQIYDRPKENYYTSYIKGNNLCLEELNYISQDSLLSIVNGTNVYVKNVGECPILMDGVFTDKTENKFLCIMLNRARSFVGLNPLYYLGEVRFHESK